MAGLSFISPGNWTGAVKNGLGDNMSTYKYTVAYGAPENSKNPDTTCPDKTFSASYKCGADPTTRNIGPIANAIRLGAEANFNCTSLSTTCNSLRLTLGDDGILTITNSAGLNVWDSTKAPLNATALPTTVTRASTEFAPQPSNNNFTMPTGMAYNRSYITSTDVLEVGQYIGSPNGRCRLEMHDTDLDVIGGTWSSAPGASLTTGYVNTLVRYGILNTSSASSWVVKIIPSIGTTIPSLGQTILESLNVSGTDPLPITGTKVLQTSSNQGKPWITFANNGDTVVIPSGATVRYGKPGQYYNKTYSAQTTITVGIKEFLTFVKMADEGNNNNITTTITAAKDTLVRYGKNDTWVYAIKTGSITVNNSSFPGSSSETGKQLDFCTSIPTPSLDFVNTPGENKLQMKMSPNASTGKTLQVVYNAAGCSDELPLNKDSSNLYSIPWTYRENLNKIGYVNQNGQLQLADNSTVNATYSAADPFIKLTNSSDQSSYGLYGNDLGSLITNVTDESVCKQTCIDKSLVNATAGGVNNEGISASYDFNSTTNPVCVGFEYEKIGKTCQLKGSGAITGGIRRISNDYNASNKKNYEYYARMKGFSGLNSSCPSDVADVRSITGSAWNNFTLNNTAITSTTKCGLPGDPAVAAARIALGETDLSLNRLIDPNSGTLGGTVNALYQKYLTLKDRLFNNKRQLDASLNELQASKNELKDWSGEQSEQLDALLEDRELNSTSQNFKYVLWTILAIIIIFLIFKFAKYVGDGKTPSIIKSLDLPKVPAILTPAAT